MKYLAALLTTLLSVSATFAANHDAHPSLVSVPAAVDLKADGKIARKENKAILILVSQEHCSYCVQIKQEVIGPMIRGGSYENALLIRELPLDGASTVIDFKGVTRDNHSFAYDYKVSMTPTLLFLDSNGQELSEKMVGMQTADMYYYYVDQSIQAAIAKLGHPSGN